MKRKLAIVPLFLGMMACSGTSREYLQKNHTRTHIDLKINIYDNKNDMVRSLKKKFPRLYTLPEGVAIWDTTTNKCEIHVVEPKKAFDINTWGHELLHCVYGSWHGPEVKF
jgi:hypothetical protein